MLWLCVKDNRYSKSQMCIITGPRIEIALGLILRMKRILESANIVIRNKETVLELNGVIITAFPSNNLATYRGLTSPGFIFLDEGDFFNESNIREVRDTTERYIAKSKPYIVMVSTPNKPDLLFQQIEEEPEDKTMYHRLFFNYQWGIDKMFTQDEIDLQRASPGFDREYDLKYAGMVGDIFSIKDIDNAIALGEQYKGLPINQYTQHICGIDPAFGSKSKAALYVVELDSENDIVLVIIGREYDQTTPSHLANEAYELHRQINNLWYYVDGSNRGFVNELKVMFDESLRWEQEKTKTVSPHSNKVIPIHFGTEHKKLLEHTYFLISAGHVAIPKEYDKLITSLRTATGTDFDLDKEKTVSNDSLDALRLALREIKFAQQYS